MYQTMENQFPDFNTDQHQFVKPLENIFQSKSLNEFFPHVLS